MTPLSSIECDAMSASVKSSPRLREPFVLAIDLGTSSTKAAIFDGTGSRVLETTSQHAYPLIADPSGRAELSAATVAQAFDQCIAGSIAAFRVTMQGKPFQIAAVGVSCFWHSLLGLNKSGRPE